MATTTKKKTSKTTTKKAAGKGGNNYKFSKTEKARSKSQIYTEIAEQTEVAKKDVKKVFDALEAMIAQDLKKAGPQEFRVPGLMKINVQHKPATKARKGTNPFTGEEMMFKAKPARNVVKVRPLKNLKEMV